MKKILILTYIIFITNYAKSQAYIPMVEDSMLIMNGILGYDFDEPVMYKYLGDTIIKENNYFKCYHESNIKDSNYSITTTMNYYGAIREINKKVFFVFKNDTIENKLYDFSLSLQDTTTVLFRDRNFNTTVNIIYKSLTTNSYYGRNEYRYDIISPPAWYNFKIIIEGFGNYGLYASDIDTNYFTRRHCVIKKNNSSHNIPANYTKCYQNIVATFVSIKEYEKEKISIFPNPSQNKVTIKAEKTISDIIIMDIQGKKIKKYKINSTKKELDISFLNKGIYMLKISTKNGIVIKKLVKE